MKYPHIEFAMLVVAQDQGISKYPRSIDTFEFDKVTVEKLFEQFTSDQLAELAAGDQEEYAKIFRKAKTKAADRSAVHAALDEIYESVVL